MSKSSEMHGWTVFVAGNCALEAKLAGFVAFYSDGITAIEIHDTRSEARKQAKEFGRVIRMIL